MPQTAVRVLEAAFIAYPVLDMKRARQFYESIFHLTPTNEFDSENWVEYDLNGTIFSLGHMDGWDPTSSGSTLALEVDDFELTMQTLRDANVAMTMGPMETPVCWMVSILDSEGNSLMVHKRKK